MFSRPTRLSRADFPLVLRGARRRSTHHFSALVSSYGSGYAVVVSKKTARLSVTRHRLKRRVREALRALPIDLPPSAVIYPRAEVLSMRYDALQEELIHLLAST